MCAKACEICAGGGAGIDEVGESDDGGGVGADF